MDNEPRRFTRVHSVIFVLILLLNVLTVFYINNRFDLKGWLSLERSSPKLAMEIDPDEVEALRVQEDEGLDETKEAIKVDENIKKTEGGDGHIPEERKEQGGVVLTQEAHQPQKSEYQIFTEAMALLNQEYRELYSKSFAHDSCYEEGGRCYAFRQKSLEMQKFALAHGELRRLQPIVWTKYDNEDGFGVSFYYPDHLKPKSAGFGQGRRNLNYSDSYDNNFRSIIIDIRAYNVDATEVPRIYSELMYTRYFNIKRRSDPPLAYNDLQRIVVEAGKHEIQEVLTVNGRIYYRFSTWGIEYDYSDLSIEQLSAEVSYLGEAVAYVTEHVEIDGKKYYIVISSVDEEFALSSEFKGTVLPSLDFQVSDYIRELL